MEDQLSLLCTVTTTGGSQWPHRVWSSDTLRQLVWKLAPELLAEDETGIPFFLHFAYETTPLKDWDATWCDILQDHNVAVKDIGAFSLSVVRVALNIRGAVECPYCRRTTEPTASDIKSLREMAAYHQQGSTVTHETANGGTNRDWATCEHCSGAEMICPSCSDGWFSPTDDFALMPPGWFQRNALWGQGRNLIWTCPEYHRNHDP
jgi:hypothetical protein